jgi:hypothetical protein
MARKTALFGSVLFAAVALGLFFRSTGPHHYRITITKDSDGVLQAEKDPNDGKFEIDYAYPTSWEFVNQAGEAVVVQIVENTSGPCHVRFSPAGSVFCESRTITIAANASDTTLSATAEDMSFWQYWPFAFYAGDLKVGKVGEVLVPKDPDLEVERDYSFSALIAALLSVLLFFVWRRRR